jgi:Amt family ammonium transporter
MITLFTRLGIALSCQLLAPQAMADAAVGSIDSGNTAWIMTSTALVLFMTIPGLALFYGGLVRSKNVLSVLMQCFAITCLVSVLWLVVVYSMAFAEGNALVGGLGSIFMGNLAEGSVTGDLPESVFAMFQLTFAIITPALIVGAFAERMRFAAMLLFSGMWLVVVYGPVTHWVWGGGWLGQMGLLDFAGGTVVHVTAGVAALVCAMYLGPRRGFPKTAMPPHNMTMVLTGAAMLWVGWFGFNGGSALAANGDAGMAILVTHMSASAGALTWMACEWFKFGKPRTGHYHAGVGFCWSGRWTCHWRAGGDCVLQYDHAVQATAANRRFTGCVSCARCRWCPGDDIGRNICQQQPRRVQRAGLRLRHDDGVAITGTGYRRGLCGRLYRDMYVGVAEAC